MQAALGQVGLMLAILGAGAAFTHYHVAHMVRPDHSTAAYMEDSKAGARHGSMLSRPRAELRRHMRRHMRARRRLPHATQATGRATA